MRDHLERIERLNPELNAIVSLRDGDELLAEAAERDAELARGERRGWMHGLPHAIKDLDDAAGIPTVAGSPLNVDNVPAEDGRLAARIKARGRDRDRQDQRPRVRLRRPDVQPRVRADPQPVRHVAHARREQRRRRGRRWRPGCCPSPTAATTSARCATPPRSATCSASGPSIGRVAALPTDDRVPARHGHPRRDGPQPGRRRAADGDHRRPGARAAVQHPGGPGAVRRAARSGSSGARVAWLGDLGGHLAMEPGILELCARALAGSPFDVDAPEPGFDPEEVWRATITLRFFDATWLLDLDQEQLKPELRYEAEGAGTPHRARRCSGPRPSARGSSRPSARCSTATTSSRCRAPRCSRSTSRPTGRATSPAARWTPTIAGWRWSPTPRSPGCPRSACPPGFHDGLPMGLQLIGRPRGDLAVLQAAHTYDEATRWVERCPPS